MKKLLFTLSALVALSACGDGKKPEETKPATTETTTPATTAPALDEKTLELLASKGCTTCHGIDKKVIGPSYQDVAERYKDSPAGIVDTLVNKVLNGGSGNWGTVAMTANKNTVTPEEAKTLVTFVLSLKK